MQKIIAWAVFGCVSACLVATTAFAQVETTPIPPNPKPDFSSMAFLAGTWNCTESNTRRPRPYTYTNKTTMDSSGYWMVTNTVNHPSSWAPRPLDTQTRQTFDPSTSRWVTLSTDNQGGYDVSESTGWSGQTIVWKDMTYPKTNNTSTSGDTTITKVSDTKTTYASSFTEPTGRTVDVKGTCTKG